MSTAGMLYAESTAATGTGDRVGLWDARADSAQAALDRYFWFPPAEIYYSNTARSKTVNYWWQAHALDVLVMGYRRTGDSLYPGRMISMYQGILGSGGFTDDYYDDMEWMALALLRSYEATGESVYFNEANALWKVIKGGWTDSPGGGGIQWQTTGIYKNVPANAPACILACKLFEDFGDSSNLTWARNIHAWLDSNLVNAQTGIILDGIAYKNSVGTPNKGSYSYNYGTYIGASLDLYRITGDSPYLNEAVREAEVADSIFAPSYGVLRSEGTGDGGLFNGIYMYYLANLIREPALGDSLQTMFGDFLLTNADSLWSHAQSPGTGLFNDNWLLPPSGTVSLSVQLSGVTLLEAAAEITGDTALTVVKPIGAAVPRIFHLYQNFPNPFNPSTEIRFTLNRPGIVNLSVYDALGQLVEEVAHGYRTAGDYEYSLNLNRFASGIYFYKLQQGTYAITRKMVLLK